MRLGSGSAEAGVGTDQPRMQVPTGAIGWSGQPQGCGLPGITLPWQQEASFCVLEVGKLQHTGRSHASRTQLVSPRCGGSEHGTLGHSLKTWIPRKGEHSSLRARPRKWSLWLPSANACEISLPSIQPQSCPADPCGGQLHRSLCRETGPAGNTSAVTGAWPGSPAPGD